MFKTNKNKHVLPKRKKAKMPQGGGKSRNLLYSSHDDYIEKNRQRILAGDIRDFYYKYCHVSSAARAGVS